MPKKQGQGIMNNKIIPIWIAGVDEVGRGPLAGPVLAAAVILDPNRPIEGLNDSKLLSERKRESLFGIIKDKAIAWSIGRAEVEEIDAINILQASLLAMKRAIEGLSIMPSEVLVDGIHAPKIHIPVQTIIKGDQTVPSISAASIIAKVTRDSEMVAYDLEYPKYGFAEHKGYPTKAHLAALIKYGATSIHRKSFAPVKLVAEEC